MFGFQSLVFNRVFVRSQIGLARTPHSCGHGLSPKLRRSETTKRSSSGSWVQVCKAVFAFRWQRQNADLKSIFVAKILWFGYFRRAAMAQFIILCRALPNMQGMKSQRFTLLFTERLEPHSKLWSWVRRSFSMTCPCSLIVFCEAMFMGDRTTPGKDRMILRGSKSPYPWMMSFSTSSWRRAGSFWVPL